MTTVTKDSVKTNMSNEIREMLIEEYNIKTDDIDKENQVEQIKHINDKEYNERFNTKFTKQDRVLKTTDKRALENVNFNWLLDENISIRKKLKKTHKIQENDQKTVSFSSSQKTRWFDDKVKQAQTVLQKSNKSDIKSDGDTVTALKIIKKMDEQQKYEKIGLKEIIKKLNKTIDKNEALLKQKNCSQSDLEKNMKKIKQLINQLQQCEERLTKYEDFNVDKSEWKKQVLELENEMRNIKLYNIKNLHDIVDSHSKINQLQITTKKFESEFDNVKSQINQHDECKISREKTMKRIEKLEKEHILLKREVASSKKCYVENQKATVMADDQSTKTTDTEKFEIKDVIFQVASKVTVCIKEVTTLICDIFTFKDEEETLESFKETKPSNFMYLLQQLLQKTFAYTTKDLNDNDNTSKVNYVKESPNMTKTPKIVYELSSRKCECGLTKQLEDTNMDNKLIDVEQGEAKIKETHVIKTKKHDKVPEVDSAKDSFYSKSLLYSHVSKDYDMTKVNKERYKNMIYPKSDDFELLEDKENIDVNCQSIRESSKSTLPSKSTKPLKSSKSIKNLPARNVNAAQHHCNVSENDICTLCNLSKKIFVEMEN